MRKITIQLYGHFRMMDCDQNDVTPVSEKAQAMMAMLVTTKGMKRTRTWLQDKLWSESDRKRGGDNLRQTLRTLRKALKDDANIIQANRHAIWLDDNCIDVQSANRSRTDTFLEGIDIADPEFGDWLRLQRDADTETQQNTPIPARAAEAKPRQKAQLALVQTGDGGANASFLETQFSSLISRNVFEAGLVEIASEIPPDPSTTFFIATFSAVQLQGGALGLRAALSQPARNREFWFETGRSEGLELSVDQDIDLLGLAFRLQSTLAREISNVSSRADQDSEPKSLLSTVLPQIFSFRRKTLADAHTLLDQAMDSDNAALFLGWQSQIATIDLIEKFTDSPEVCIERGVMFATKAVEADHMNSVVLSTAANAHLLLDWDMATGAELASLSVRVNPANPLSWWAYANAALYSDAPAKALKAAQISSKLSARSHLQFWCDNQVGLAAMQTGDWDKAIRSFETAAALSPQFRPPRRYLLALYAMMGRHDSASRMARQLKRLEPDFSLDRFVRDPEYPVSLAKRNDAWAKTDFGAIDF